MDACILLGKCLTDSVAVRALAVLADGPLCICEIQSAMQLPERRIQLSLDRLRGAGLVLSERRGRWMSYSLNSEREPFLSSLMADLSDELEWDMQLTLARKRLNLVLKRRVAGWCPPSPADLNLSVSAT